MIWQEAEYLEQLEAIETDCQKAPSLLLQIAERRGLAATSPQVISLLSIIESIAQRCREERESFGFWRDDGLDPNKILGGIDDELEAFVKTLNTTLAASGS